MYANQAEAMENTPLDELVRLEKMFTERAKVSQSTAAKLRRVIKRRKRMEQADNG